MANIGENFPQSRQARREKLLEIKRNSEAISTVKVPGHGLLNVYRIPLECLSYNPYNTRFLAQAKTLERRIGRKLRDDDAENETKIEDFIWNEKRDKNESTIESLLKNGQLQPGVVTIEGVILSGNRRFRLINDISRNPSKYSNNTTRIDNLRYFEAAILDDSLSEKDIVRYEAFYQYGVEDKTDYDPIQKYIAAAEQKNLGFDEQEIADNFATMTDGNKKTVVKWLEVYALMEEYLTYIGEPGIYTALEGKEEAFLELRTTFNSFNNGRAGTGVMWAYDENDLADLKMRFFDYIRTDMPTHNFRIFKSVFQNKAEWDKFNGRVETQTQTSNVKSFDEYRKDYNDTDEGNLSKIRGRDFKEKNSKALGSIYKEVNAAYAEKELEATPIKVTSSIIDKIEKLQAMVEDNKKYDDAFLQNLNTIQEKIEEIKQKIGK